MSFRGSSFGLPSGRPPSRRGGPRPVPQAASRDLRSASAASRPDEPDVGPRRSDLELAVRRGELAGDLDGVPRGEPSARRRAGARRGRRRIDDGQQGGRAEAPRFRDDHAGRPHLRADRPTRPPRERMDDRRRRRARCGRRGRGRRGAGSGVGVGIGRRRRRSRVGRRVGVGVGVGLGAGVGGGRGWVGRELELAGSVAWMR